MAHAIKQNKFLSSQLRKAQKMSYRFSNVVELVIYVNILLYMVGFLQGAKLLTCCQQMLMAKPKSCVSIIHFHHRT